MSGPEALPTALTAPPVTSPRALRDALAFYVHHQEALPRPSPLHRALWGAAATAHAARLVATDRALRRAALLPTGLTLAGCALLAGWATASGDADDRSPSTFQAFLVSFVALSSMPPTVLQRLWIKLANEARRALGQPPGEDPFPDEPFLHLVWREGWKAVRQTVVVAVGLVPLLVAVQLLPAGSEGAAGLGALWAFYWIVVDAFELPLEVVPGPRAGGPVPWFVRWYLRAGDWSRWLRPLRLAARWIDRLARPWREELAFTERHPAETLGFGVVAAALLAIPVAGLFFRAVAIVGATALAGRLEPEGAPDHRAPPALEPLPPPLPPG